MSKPVFYEGQHVGCLMFGEGRIACVNDETLRVNFKECEHSFHPNGAWMRDSRPTLYPIEQYRSIIANLPAPEPEKWQPKPGDWCWFWDYGYSRYAVLGKFAMFHEDMMSPYMSNQRVRYENCAPFTGELPEHLKEVQP